MARRKGIGGYPFNLNTVAGPRGLPATLTLVVPRKGGTKSTAKTGKYRKYSGTRMKR